MINRFGVSYKQSVRATPPHSAASLGVDRVVQETEQSGRRRCDLLALKSRASGSVSDQSSVDVAKNKGSNSTKATQRTWADVVKGSQSEKREKSNDCFELRSFS